jgi:hypothetical protein
MSLKRLPHFFASIIGFAQVRKPSLEHLGKLNPPIWE